MALLPFSSTGDDLQLWQQFREGDAFALGTLVKKYYPTLFHYATKFTRDTSRIEDCIQEVFLRLWDRRPFLGDPPSVKFYLLKALRHQLIKEHQQEVLKEPLDWEGVGSGEEHAESRIIQQESLALTAQQLKQSVAALSKRQQEALYLRYYENLRYEEIAQLMGINAQSVANLLGQSLKKLRECWPYLALLLLGVLPD
jgi:RNA polymerase sigma factor (sigma-70 family)